MAMGMGPLAGLSEPWLGVMHRTVRPRCLAFLYAQAILRKP